jgi:hypothetical protein
MSGGASKRQTEGGTPPVELPVHTFRKTRGTAATKAGSKKVGGPPRAATLRERIFVAPLLAAGPMNIRSITNIVANRHDLEK